MPDHYLCVHGHFYQPPRGDPFADDDISPEADAAPYRDFNEKITQQCYTPNAKLGNFELMSYNINAHLARWLDKNAPDTYQRIIAADAAHRAKYEVGNALAQSAHHTILPLCSKQDKLLQIKWGQMSFEYRFGRPATGMWLPEMAVDLETLQVLHDCGIQFTVLGQNQLVNAQHGAGPYWVNLPSGDRLAVYCRDDAISNQIAFNVPLLGGAGRWAHNVLAPLHKSYPRLLLIATEGETFGHHHLGEEHFLHWLLKYEAHSVGFETTTLTRDFRENPPPDDRVVEIKENTAWSCWHGLARWATGCECTKGDSRWKKALRDALDDLANQVDTAYLSYASALNLDPWSLRVDYFRVCLGALSPSEFLRDARLTHLSAEKSQTLLNLLQAEFFRQRMYVSCTFYEDALDAAEPRYGIANAVRAALLVTRATGADFLPALRKDMLGVTSSKTSQTGAHVLDEIVAHARDLGFMG